MSDTRAKDWAVRPETACLVIITLLGACMRLYKLADCSLWYDECASLYLGRYVPHPWQLFNPDNNTEAPINAITTWAWYGLVRLVTHFPAATWQSDFAIRLLPCLLSTATIPILYVFARKVLDDTWGALLAAFFFAVSPFFIYYGQELRVYAFVVPAALITMYVMLRALESGERRYWIGLCLGLTVLVYAHFFSVWTVFTLSVYFILVWPFDRKYIVAWTIANASALVLMAPGLYLAYEMNTMVSKIEYRWYETPTWKTAFVTFKIFFAGYGPTVWAYWSLFGIALALHVIGVASLFRTRWRAAVLIAVLTWVPILGNVYVWSTRYFSFYEHRLFVLSGAVAMIGVAAGLRALPWRGARLGVVAGYLVLTAPMLGDLYAHRIHPLDTHRFGIYDKVDIRDAAAYIDEHWEEGDLTVVPSHLFSYPLHHYLPHPSVRVGKDRNARLEYYKTVGGRTLSDNHGLTPVVMEKAVANAQRLWFMESHGITFEWKPDTNDIRKLIEENWDLVEKHELDGLDLMLYTRRPAAPTPAAKP